MESSICCVIVKYLSGDFALRLGLRCIESKLDASPWVLNSLPTEKIWWDCPFQEIDTGK